MNHICPEKSVCEYEREFGPYQDYYNDGARTTISHLIEFIKAEFETDNKPVLEAINSGYAIMTTLWVNDEESDELAHSIVIEGYSISKRGVHLVYYNPLDGRHYSIGYAALIQSNPIYFINILK
jgi:hypothetical protein